MCLGILPSCDAPTGPSQIAWGDYALVRVGGVAIPTGHPCGGGGVLTGSSLILGPDRSATYTIRIDVAGSGTWAFAGVGTYTDTEMGVRVRVRGQWAPEGERHTSHFDFAIVDGVLRQYVGGECDAHIAADYELQARR